MESLGFICDDGANVADFLTGVTVPTERKVREDMEAQFPRTHDAIRERYEATEIKRNMEAEYSFPTADTTRKGTEEFKQAVTYDKHKSLPKKSLFTASFRDQVKA